MPVTSNPLSGTTLSLSFTANGRVSQKEEYYMEWAKLTIETSNNRFPLITLLHDEFNVRIRASEIFEVVTDVRPGICR